MANNKPIWFTSGSATLQKRRFRDYSTDALTSKMWILPDGRVAASSVWHYHWLLSNRAVAKEFGMPIDGLPEEEEPIRLAALRAGFVRLNYVHRSGTLTIEANRLRLGTAIMRAILGVVTENLRDIYVLNFNMLSVPKRGRSWLYKSESVALFTHPLAERRLLIPFVGKKARRRR